MVHLPGLIMTLKLSSYLVNQVHEMLRELIAGILDLMS